MAKIDRIVIPLYPDFDILDVCGPLAMFSSVAGVSGIKPVLAVASPGLVKSLQGVSLQVDSTFPDLGATDAIWVPGGFGPGYLGEISGTSPTVAWLKEHGPQAGYVCSICTGAILLGAAGLLQGYTATTHWMFQQSLAMFPDVQLASGFPRYWIDRNRITGGGISSGLDASLAVIAAISNGTHAMYAQLINQYAPDPPYNAGTPTTTPPEVLGPFYQIYGDGAAELQQAVAKLLGNQTNH
jgi:transcriptional regulator GlxA family with amidase domain